MSNEMTRITDGMVVKVASMPTAVSVAKFVLDGFSIKSDDEFNEAADSLSLMRRAAVDTADALREAWRPIKEMERNMRDSFAPDLAVIDQATLVVRKEMERWRASQAEAAAKEAARRQAEADAAADPSGDAPPAQVVVAKPGTTAKGATAIAYQQRRVRAVEVVDVSAVLASQWSGMVSVDLHKATAAFADLVRRGVVDYPAENGTVVNGILFRTSVATVSARR